MKVAFLCCHLTGTGHLVRTLALAKAVVGTGGKALVLSGGRPLAHLDTGGVGFVQLPPVTVPDFDFSTLRQPDGTVADTNWMAARQSEISAALEGFGADALVTELFPLGRRILAAEFEHAIAEVRRINPVAAILASVRDIPEPPRKPARLAEAEGRLIRLYDRLLVHGDPDLVPLGATWDLPGFADRTHYTGYVASNGPVPESEPGQTVLVAVGGGVLGRQMLGIAAEAAALSPRPWHLLTGGADAAALAASLHRPGLTVEPARADYRALLAGAAVSVSLAGYNTVVDLAQTDTPAILVPFDERDEKEQSIRAMALSRLSGLSVIRADQLTPAALANAVEAAAAGPRRKALPIRLGGADKSARLIRDTIQEKRA